MADLEPLLCSSAAETSSTSSSPDSPSFTNLPFELVRRSNSLRSRPSISVRPVSPISNPASSRPVTPTAPEPPQVVVLCLWPHATSSQIAFYTEGYASLYPSAQVLALRSSWSSRSPDREGVLDLLTAQHEKPSLRSDSILLHLFGHTGAFNACDMLRGYRIRTNEALNVKAIISDTEPTTSLANFQAALQSPAQLMLLLYITIISFWSTLSSILRTWEHSTTTWQIRDDLTNPLLLPTDARKTFVFAQQNLMFCWGEASEDGGEALDRQDYAVKRRSVDAKGRWTGDQERYWMGIEGVWEGN
jgi:hypothetical protein